MSGCGGGIGRTALVFGAAACIASAVCIVPAELRAQEALVARADTLLIAGRVFSAESLYYDAVRIDPRNPVARLGLGRYLAERGALRVGAVLMEEARYFGGDPATVARALAPVYEAMGAYESLASLPASPLTYPERLRAEWLRDHPPGVSGPDSGFVPYHVTDGQLLGRVVLRIGDDSVLATIDARVRGLVLDSAWSRRAGIRHFASRGDRDPARWAAVTTGVRMGEFALTNVATRFEHEPSPGLAVIGMDVVGQFAPTFDPRADRMLFRKSGRVEDRGGDARIATLTNESGVYVVKTETVFPLGHPDVQRVLRYSRWTLDPRHGELIVDEAGVGPGTPAGLGT